MNIAEKQINAYNSRNMEDFFNCYHDEIIVRMLQTDQVLAQGKEQLKDVMNPTFSGDTSSHTTILSTMEQGNLIVQMEEIEGHIDGKIVRTLSIYETKDGLISKLWFGGRTVTDVA